MSQPSEEAAQKNVVAPTRSKLSNGLSYLWSWRNTAIVIIAPLILLPLVFCFEAPDAVALDVHLKSPMRCAYVIVLMILFWTMECLPLAVTALLPMVLYPLLMVVEAEELAPKYMSESNIAFVGSIIVVAAFERTELHKLFALRVLTLVGSQPRWLLCGFMLVSWFLSMWTSNTMTTYLLVPIALSVTSELRQAMKNAVSINTSPEDIEALQPGDVEMTAVSNKSADLPLPGETHSRKSSVSSSSSSSSSVSSAAASIAPDLELDANQRKYENIASIGGTVTIIGTGPNLIMKQAIEEAYTNHGCVSPLNFMSWMVYTIPMSLLFLVLLWMWVQIYFIGIGYLFGLKKSSFDDHKDQVLSTIRNIYDNLPPLSIDQAVVLGHFIVMILLLVTRTLNSEPLIGWELIAPGYVSESTATILVAFSLFIFPVTFPKRNRETGKMSMPRVLVNWTQLEKDFPFGLILLIGGGMAAAHGASESQLAQLLANVLNIIIGDLSNELALLIIIIFIIYVTEVMSNTACVTLMMPILALMADQRVPAVNPMLFMFPTGLAASFAFMFPVATPPNAVVFATGKFKITDMVSAGFVVNILGILVAFFAATTYGGAYFKLFEPAWVLIGSNGTNGTTQLPTTTISENVAHLYECV